MAFSTMPSSGADRLRVTADNQTINALAGDDWITSAFNASTLFGGLGHDRLAVRLDLIATSASDFVRTAALSGGKGNDCLVSSFSGHSTEEANFEFSSRQSGGTGNDHISITASSTSMIYGLGGNFDFDIFGGGGADDIRIEVNGADVSNNNFVDAGSGADTVHIASAWGNDFGNTTNKVEAGDGDDDVTVRADSGFFSPDGDNILWGGAGDDRLDATVEGTGGLNDLHGGSGNDLLIADASVASDSASTAHNKVSGDDGGDVLFLKAVSYGNLAIVRNEGYGGGGNDRITAVAGVGTEEYPAELLSLGTVLRGGSGDDVLTATTFFYVLYDDPAGGAELYGGSGDDVLRVYDGIENTLDGGAGDDAITGGSGADRIIGGAGADRLRGGGGDDAFVFLWMTGGTLAARDTIFDFGVGTAARGEDVIDLSAIDANATIVGNQAFAFGGTARKGVGYVWVEESATIGGSLVIANTGGPRPLVIAVEDGQSRDAADWREGDFVL